MMHRFALAILGFVCFTLGAAAQNGTSSRTQTTIYPEEVYPGENIITVRNPSGIDKIRARTAGPTHVQIPPIMGCPTEVVVRITVDDPTAKDLLELTVYDCDGRYHTSELARDAWTILHESTGPVQVGSDTCVDAEVVVEGETKVLNSIVSSDPELTVRIADGSTGPWEVGPGSPLRYFICYRPTKPGRREGGLTLHVRRRVPNGGLEEYSMVKPITLIAVAPPPPKKVEPPKVTGPVLPPIKDPTTFRNLVAPSAETMSVGDMFVGNFDVAGWLVGYGVTDDIMLLGGGALLPSFIQKVAVATIGVKYRPVKVGSFQAAVGFQYGYSSSDTRISASTPYVVITWGSTARLNIAAGYSFKTHTNDAGSFNENATVLVIGGEIQTGRSWKLVGETYFIESSGLRPVALTSRWFGNNFAVDVGLVVDFEGTSGVHGTGTLSGEIQRIRAAPILSGIYVFGK